MALAFRTGSYIEVGDASGEDLTVTKPTGTAEGDIIVIGCYGEDAAATVTISGFTSLHKVINTGAFFIELFWKRAGGSEPADYTADFSTTLWRIAVGAAYSGGTGTGDVEDVSDGAQGDGGVAGTQLAPSVITTGTNRMLVFLAGGLQGGTVTNIAGAASNLRGQNGSLVLGDALIAAAGATGTSEAEGWGTQDWAAIHSALISDTGDGVTPLSVVLHEPVVGGSSF